MIMKNILFSLLIFFPGISFTQGIPVFSGLLIDTITYKKSEKSTLAPGRNNFPKKFSLINYAPTVKNQYPWGTCVGYSSAYCAMSIAHKLKTGNTISFSPYCLYNRMKKEPNNECNMGLYVSAALNKLKNDGASRWNKYENICKADYNYNSYPDKIIDYDPVTIAVRDFKNAITNYQPIVICMRVFKNKYSSTKTVSLSNSYIDENGFWTYSPSSSDEVVSGHAMCVIGYDDDKQAFLVQNSWGTGWGKNGRFWLPYSKLTYCSSYHSSPLNGNIDEAYKIHTAPNFLDDFQNYEDDDSYESNRFEYFKVTNNTHSIPTIWLSVAYQTYDGWISRGWFRCDLYEETSLDLSNRISDEIYYRIENGNGNIAWAGDGSRFFCISNESHHFTENSSCNTRKAYGKYNGSGSLSAIYNSTSRDLSGDNKVVVLELNTNPNNNSIEDNINWTGKYSLIDPVNNAPIISSVVDDSEYVLWVVNDQNTAVEFMGSTDEIKKIKQLKFSSEKTANIHISLINQNK